MFGQRGKRAQNHFTESLRLMQSQGRLDLPAAVPAADDAFLPLLCTRVLREPYRRNVGYQRVGYRPVLVPPVEVVGASDASIGAVVNGQAQQHVVSDAVDTQQRPPFGLCRLHPAQRFDVAVQEPFESRRIEGLDGQMTPQLRPKVVTDEGRNDEQALVLAGNLGDQSFDALHVAIKTPEYVGTVADARHTRAEHPQRIPVIGDLRIEVLDQRSPCLVRAKPARRPDESVDGAPFRGAQLQR